MVPVAERDDGILIVNIVSAESSVSRFKGEQSPSILAGVDGDHSGRRRRRDHEARRSIEKLSGE